LVSAIAVVLTTGTFTAAIAHEGLPSDYNFRDDIRPIFVKHCAGCHRPGGAGPMSLLSYSEAVPWANSVKMQVLGEQMPPWLPVDGVGAFRHTRSLSAAEIDILIDWTIGQTPEGEPLTADELGELETGASAWAMEAPELVLAPDAALVIGEDDDEIARCLVLPTGLAQARVASAFEVKPGLPSIVRRATISLGDSCDGARPLATWLPGQGSVSLAAGRGQELPANASLAVELLYVKGWEDEGKRLTDRTEIGVHFSDSAEAVTAMRLSESYELPDSVELLALYPELEPDASLRVEVVRPDGSVEAILVIEQFSPQWREKYLLAEPLLLPAGTVLRSSQSVLWIDFIESDTAAAE
jgi:hypothetical protein